MKLEQVIQIVDNLIATKTGRHLKEVETVVITGAWEAKTYEQIEKTCQFSLSYIKQAAAPRLWKLMSEILQQNVSKTNFRAVIEDLYQTESIPASDLSSLSAKDDAEFELNNQEQDQENLKLQNNWNEAPEINFFYGRTSELQTLKTWLIQDRCRLIAIVGMGGIGKTALSLRCAQHLQFEFELVIWRELRNPGALRQILVDLLHSTGDHAVDSLPHDFDGQISALLDNLRQHRCLIILDTSPAMFPSGSAAENYRQEYQDYGKFLKRLGQEQHQSCLMLIAREKPKEIALLEGEAAPTRALHLRDLGEAAKELLKAKKLLDEDKWSDLIQIYRGNPLALKIVANTIKELFGGKVATFLKQQTIIFGELNDLLDEQFESLSTLEEQILYWLAVNCQPTSLTKLRGKMVIPVAMAKLIEGLESLLRNSLIEKNIVEDEVGFYLEQPVVIQYVINQISDRICQEILDISKSQRLEKMVLLRTLDLIQNLDNPVQKTEHFIIRLILDRLGETFQDGNLIKQKLTKILSLLPKDNLLAVGYAQNNLKTLLSELNSHFELSFSLNLANPDETMKVF